VLVYEYQHGETLQELISTKHPEGLAPKRALRIFKELVRFAGTLHAQKYVFRDFDPRHIIIGFDDIIHVVGCGNAVERGKEMNVYKMSTNPRYTAPEIRRELSGKVVRPACDFYSLGCLLSYMLTGYEPTPVAEAPLQSMAYKRLKSDEFPDGLRLLIARCLQPLAQKRFSSAKKLLPFCTPSSVPDAQTEGFGLMDLPAPWSGPGANTSSDVKPLSPGPLVITTNPQPQVQSQAQPQAPSQDAMVPKPSKELEPKSSNVGLWVGVGLVGMLVLIVLIGLAGAIVMGIMG
jgi:serine/threonine protein kinase